MTTIVPGVLAYKIMQDFVLSNVGLCLAKMG